jgi:hypothetical protein
LSDIQPDMDAAFWQTITTELVTIHRTPRSPTTITTHWTNIYNMVLSSAKFLDSSCSKQVGQRQETNQANVNSNGNHVSLSNNSPVVVDTGPSRVMTKGRHFRSEYWAKVKIAQKTKIFEFQYLINFTAKSTRFSVNNTEKIKCFQLSHLLRVHPQPHLTW